MADAPVLTTTAGNPVADNQNSITAGQRGPVLMRDYQLLEKLAHRNRERIFPNNSNADAYYEPNSFGGPVERPELAEPPLKIAGDAARYDHRVGNDDFSQPRALFNLFDAGAKARLFSNIAAAMWGGAERDCRAAAE